MDSVLAIAPETMERRKYVSDFMEKHIYPNERMLSGGGPESVALYKELQAINKSNGYWAPHLPAEAGGMGIGFLPYAYMNEIIGRSLAAPWSFGSQAPDSGNAEILWQFGSPEIKQRFLKPLVAGDMRSCYSMTEPAGSVSD